MIPNLISQKESLTVPLWLHLFTLALILNSSSGKSKSLLSKVTSLTNSLNNQTWCVKSLLWTFRCGHMCCCMTCSSHLTHCPLCRRRIDQVVKTFRHWLLQSLSWQKLPYHKIEGLSPTSIHYNGSCLLYVKQVPGIIAHRVQAISQMVSIKDTYKNHHFQKMVVLA